MDQLFEDPAEELRVEDFVRGLLTGKPMGARELAVALVADRAHGVSEEAAKSVILNLIRTQEVERDRATGQFYLRLSK